MATHQPPSTGRPSIIRIWSANQPPAWTTIHTISTQATTPAKRMVLRQPELSEGVASVDEGVMGIQETNDERRRTKGVDCLVHQQIHTTQHLTRQCSLVL